jgi:YesN/AraC family two-component response regulator
MPEGKSGIDIIPSLRKKLPQAKIILLSNFSKFVFDKKAREAGADDFLIKIDTPPDTLIKYLQQIAF